MNGDSDIHMVDAPEPSPRPSGAHLSGPPTHYPTSIFASHAEKYRRNNQTASRSLLRPSMPSNTIGPIRRALPYSLPMPLAKSHVATISIPKSGPNFFNTPQKTGWARSFKNPRIRAAPYLVPANSTSRRLSPSEYRRLTSRQTNPTPNPLKLTWNPLNDLRVVNARARLERASAALPPGVDLNLPTKRPVSDAEEPDESEPKRARFIETQRHAVPSTPVQSPVRRMPGAFPESPATSVETQPAAQNVATRNNIALAGLSIYARIRRITGVVRGAHRALKQGIRTSTQFATTVGQRIRTTHAPIPTVVVEERQGTPETYESATSDASAQLQADLTAHTQALLPPRYAIPVASPSAQLHAELVDHVSHIPPPSTIVAVPQTPSTISANLIAQDQPSVQEEIMSEPSATHPEVQPTTSIQVQATPTLTEQSTSTSFEVAAFPDIPADEDPDVLRIRAAFDRMRGGRPRPEPFPNRQAFFNRLAERPRPVTPSDTSLDAEVNSELAQECEEQIQEASSTPQNHPTADEQDITQVEEEQSEEQHIEEQEVEEQAAEEHIDFDCAAPPDNDEEYDPNAYYPGVPPLMPERRFIFNAEFRRKAAEKEKAERKAAAAREAVEGPVREFIAATKALKAAEAKQARDALRPIIRRRDGDNPNQRQIEAAIQETINQLAATTVHDEVPEIFRPPRNVHWPVGEIDFGKVPACPRWYDPQAPPIELWEGPEPRDRAGFEKYEGDIRRDQEKWEREQQQQVVQQRERALGRVGVPAGHSAVRSLTPTWEQRLTSAMRSSPHEVLARTGDADLTKEKLRSCWTPLAWLNDEVINGHLKYTVNYLRQQANNLGPNDDPKYFAFNSFFYSKLRDSGYHGVARWARRAKIGGAALLKVETVFIPVHEGAHWTLLVVSPKNRTIEYFDSLGGNPDSFVENAKRWLKGELGNDYDESEWLFLNTPSPQQDNGSDCGVFLLTSAKAIALGLEPTVYGPRDIDLIRRKIVAELMNGGLSGDFDPQGTSGVKRL